MGETEISIPRDRASEFESMLIPKYKRDVSEIDRKVLAMYSRGMSQRDISATIDDIYGFKLSAEQISKITDFVLERNWQNRPLKSFYPFIFVDCRQHSPRLRRLYNFGVQCRREKRYFGFVDSGDGEQTFLDAKILYLRITEFYRKCADRPVANWSLVRNQLLLDERMSNFFAKFDR